VLFGDACCAPVGGPVCDVITRAKTDLKAGQTLDGIGGFHCYGSIDNSEVCQSGNLLPMGLSEGCQLLRDVSKDDSITYADVRLPPGRLSDRLRAEQQAFFGAI
jgi:predicted homoserine dehydrogenase-like protein